MKGRVLILILIILISSGCAIQEIVLEGKNQLTQPAVSNVSNQTQEIEPGNMPKVIFIIAQTNFRDEELEKPKQILESAGYGVDVASITNEHAIGMLGAVVKPDLAVKDVNISDYALIVVVGGSGAPQLANHPEVLNLLEQAKASNKKLAAICRGPMVLAKGGVLQGKQATVFKDLDSVSALESGGATFIDQKIVVDNGLVTANGPGASTEFGNELVNLLKN
jgi:protease I